METISNRSAISLHCPQWLIGLRRSSALRLLGKGIEWNCKRLIHMLVMWFLKPCSPVDPASLNNIQRILLLRPNFRIGNALISTSLVLALRERFPAARLDYVGTDTTSILLQNLPLDHLFEMSRSFIVRPWAYLRLLKVLHEQQYDLVVQIGRGSFTGMTYMNFLNARYRVGAGKWSKAVCNIRVDLSGAKHAYDRPIAVARTLGLSCRNRPFYATTQEERENAMKRLSMVRLSNGNNTVPFAALFIGGHKDKRWPIECWIDLADKLRQAHKRIILLLGPEEVSMGPKVREALGPSISVLDPLPLRDFAAVLQQARLVVTPDTGPMHLAVALDVPTIAIIQSNISLRYAPRGDRDVVLRQPTPGQVLKTIQAHSVWPDISA